jgi:hypothetical protein
VTPILSIQLGSNTEIWWRPYLGLRLPAKFRSRINAVAMVIPSVAEKPLAPSGKSVALSRAILSH